MRCVRILTRLLRSWRMNNEPAITGTAFLTDVKQIIDAARSNAVRSIDFCRVQMYWNIGQRIFEEEQQGKERADYGAYLIKNLAQTLEPEYGSGFSVRQLEMCRQFYRLYPILERARRALETGAEDFFIGIGKEGLCVGNVDGKHDRIPPYKIQSVSRRGGRPSSRR